MSDEQQLTFFEKEEGADAEESAGRGVPKRRSRRVGLSRRWMVALWVLFFGWIGVGFFLLPWDRTIDEPEAPAPGPEVIDLLMLVIRGEADDPPALALVARSAATSRVILLPATTVVELPGSGPRALEGALEEAGIEGLVTSVANALGAEVPDALVAEADQVRSLVDALGGVEVDVPETVEVEEEGAIRTLFSAGQTRMDGDTFLGFITAQIPQQGELDRVARQGPAWRGLLAALGEAGGLRVLAGWDAHPDGVGVDARVLDAARSTSQEFVTLPVRRVGVTGADLYRIDDEELSGIQHALGAARTIEAGDGYRIRLLVGTEAPVGPAVARRLVEAGYVVVLTGRASEPYDETRVVIAENSPELRERAEELVDLLGAGRLGVFRRQQTVFDVTLVIGRDWAEAHGFVESEAEPET